MALARSNWWKKLSLSGITAQDIALKLDFIHLSQFESQLIGNET
jgi:hypothetical protein